MGEGVHLLQFVIARSVATKQSMVQQVERWIASRSLSSGAHSRDPLARNDDYVVRRSQAVEMAGYAANPPYKRPDGQITQNLSSPVGKNIPLPPSGKSMASLCASHPNEGRLAIVTNVAVRCGGRGRAFDERRGLRTAKSCGPDAPTLASSFAEWSAKRRWQKSPVTGESTK